MWSNTCPTMNSVIALCCILCFRSCHLAKEWLTSLWEIFLSSCRLEVVVARGKKKEKRRREEEKDRSFHFLADCRGEGEKIKQEERWGRGVSSQKAFCEDKTIILCWTLQHLAPCALLQNTRGNTIVDEPLQLQLHGGGVCSLHFRIRISLWLKSQKPFFARNLHLLVLNYKTHSLPRICTCLLSPAQTHYPELCYWEAVCTSGSGYPCN